MAASNLKSGARLRSWVPPIDVTLRRRSGALTVGQQRIKPGTRLLRQWNGKTHQVMVVEGGFEYEGECYKSLSAIARLITGTRWSGPLFFGVK